MNSSDRHLGQTCSIMLHVEASLPAWPLPKCTMTLYPVTTANWTETSAVWWLDQRFCSDSRFFFAKNRNKSNLMIGPWRGISYPSFFFFSHLWLTVENHTLKCWWTQDGHAQSASSIDAHQMCAVKTVWVSVSFKDTESFSLRYFILFSIQTSSQTEVMERFSASVWTFVGF